MLEDTVTSPNYRSYLIRLWRESEAAPWRASVTHVVTGEIRKFATAELLFVTLQGELTDEMSHMHIPRN